MLSCLRTVCQETPTQKKLRQMSWDVNKMLQIVVCGTYKNNNISKAAKRFFREQTSQQHVVPLRQMCRMLNAELFSVSHSRNFEE